MKSSLLLAVAACVALEVAAGCGGSKHGARMTVLTVTPADGAAAVGIGSALTVTFSEPIDPASVTAASFGAVGPDGPLTGTVSSTGATATFVADGQLPFGSAVTATITTAVRSVGGARLASDFVWTFTGEPDVYREVFVTSETGSGDFSSWPSAAGASGLAAADNVCAHAALAGHLAGVFHAVVSDATTDAWCHVQGFSGTVAANCGQASLPAAAGPWRRTHDLFPFSGDITQLFGPGGAPFVPSAFDESGRPAPQIYWTNTFFDGRNATLFASAPCANWTSMTSTTNVMGGFATGTDAFWVTGDFIACSNATNALLCAEEGTAGTITLPAPPAGAKRVFLTSSANTGNLAGWSEAGGLTGLAAGDAICATEASNAGLANSSSFKAWLSDSTTDARDRITADGPWARPDGVVIANSKADLLDGALFSSIDQHANGTRAAILVWTGTRDNGTRSTKNCADWTNGTSAAGDDGNSGSTAGPVHWSGSGAGVDLCNRNAPLYCFEN